MTYLGGLFGSIVTLEGIISILIAVAISIFLYLVEKRRGTKFTRKHVWIILAGAAAYGVLSLISLPIGPNTSFRVAIALLPVLSAIFGPLTGFLAGFIGHALNDAFYGSVWWSWVFISAMIGLSCGLVTLNKDFDVLGGQIKRKHWIMMYAYGILGMLAGGLMAFIGDIYMYNEAVDEVALQIALAGISDFVVLAIIGIPVVISMAIMKSGSRE